MKKCMLLLMAFTFFASAFSQEDSITLISTSVLTSFQVQGIDKVVLLKWSLAESEEYKSFDIERAEEGSSFVKVGSKLAISKSHNSAYDFVDATPKRKIILRYRLKFITKDGRISYSEVQHTRITEEQFTLKLKNNPVRSNIEIELTAAGASQALIAVISSTGQQVVSQTYRLTPGVNQLSLSGQGIQPGIYQLIVEAENERKVISLVKE